MRNGKKIIALALASIMLAALMSACGSPAEPTESQVPAASSEPVMGGELTVGIAQDLDETLDPHKMVSAGTREILFNVYEGLVKPDTDGNLIPAVAKDYGISDDGTTFTFSLRENVKFHNGAAVTADDVVYSLKRASGFDTGTPLIDSFTGISSIEKTDESTVVVTLEEPNIEFLAMFTAAIIPEGSDPAVDGVVGTGPFTYTGRVPQESISLEKFDDYWGAGAYVDSVTFRIIDNAETLVMSLKGGSLDLVVHLTAAQTAELGSEFTIVEGSMNIVQALYLNNAVEPFDDVRVRQALCYAVDKQGVLDLTAGGRGSLLGSAIYPSFGKYFQQDLVDAYDTDTEKAKQLLAEAGYPNGFEFSVTVPSNYQPHVDTATVIAEQLKSIGVTMKVELVDWNTWLSETYTARDFQATVIGLDAKNLTARCMMEFFVSDAANNFINFNSSEYDETFAQAISATDDETQVELYARLQQILSEQAASVYLQDMCDLVAMGNGLAGYEFYPLYVMDMSKVYFTA